VTTEPPPRITLPHPAPIETLPVRFHVPETGDVCLAPESYENLALNMAEFLRWITEAKWRLDWYIRDGIAE